MKTLENQLLIKFVEKSISQTFSYELLVKLIGKTISQTLDNKLTRNIHLTNIHLTIQSTRETIEDIFSIKSKQFSHLYILKLSRNNGPI